MNETMFRGKDWLVQTFLSAALGLFLGAGIASAQSLAPDRLYFPLASQHFNMDPLDYGVDSWNEFNPGVIVTWENRALTLDYGIGAFYNSFEEVSFMAVVGQGNRI